MVKLYSVPRDYASPVYLGVQGAVRLIVNGVLLVMPTMMDENL